MSIESEKPLSFAESGREKQSEPMAVTNVHEKFGIPSLLEEESVEKLSGEDMVDLDNRALRNPDAPFIVFGRPHAGEYVPTELLDRMTEGGEKIMAVCDRGTNYIFKSPRIASVGFKMSCFIVDPNRPPNPAQTSAKSKAPGKVLWEFPAYSEHGVQRDAPIYREGMEPTGEEVRDLVERTYLPYYNSMMATIGSLADRKESPNQRVLLIDGHSFMTNEAFQDYFTRYYDVKDPKREMPLFVVGDQDGNSCDRDISDAFVAALERNFELLSEKDKRELLASIGGGVVAKNLHLKGVRNVEFYGERPQGVDALQLEVNDTAIVDEEGGDYFTFQYDKRRLELIQKVVERAALEVDPILKGEKENV